MANAHVKEFTDQNFQAEVLDSSEPVLVDFWAEWCQPCRAMAPVIDELATEYAGKAKIGKLDIDAHREAATKFGIRSIPTLLIFKGGELADTIVGARPKGDIAEKLDAHLVGSA